MKHELSKERLEQIANFHRTRSLPPSHDESGVMARALLAAHEPVAYMHLDRGDVYLPEHLSAEAIESVRYTPLYTHPAPIPTAVPEDDADLVKAMAFLRETSADAQMEGWLKELRRLRAAMIQSEPDGWIPVSERMPEEDGNYWGWWSESNRQGPVWFIKSELQAQFQSSEITHWQPLPSPPKV